MSNCSSEIVSLMVYLILCALLGVACQFLAMPEALS